MAVTIASFRSSFPEFIDPVKYPDGQITFWLTNAGLMLNAGRWAALLDLGTSLFVAHHISLQAKNAATAAFGGVPGAASGPVASKGVDKVNISYDVGSVAEEKGGHWNLTTYGQQYLRLANQVGIGPVQVGPGTDAEGVSLYSMAWAGPFV